MTVARGETGRTAGSQGEQSMRQLTRARRGFTLIEILIVVIILGILAAIVIPQFSNASTSAKTSAVVSTAQSLRSQVALYKLQHNDTLPAQATFWTLMTTQTDSLGAAWTNSAANQAAGGPWGPYMQSTPPNALNGQTTVLDVPGVLYVAVGACGWAYDYNGGTGSGRIYGTDSTQLVLVGP